MGSDSSSSWTSKKDVLLETEESMLRSGWTILEKASTGQGAYYAVRNKEGEGFIYCMRVERHGGQYYRKEMSEHQGPAMDDCPKRVLDAVPCPDHEWAREFRQRCLAALTPVPSLTGKKVELYGKEYQVLGTVKRSYAIKELVTGQIYRLSQRQERHVKIVA